MKIKKINERLSIKLPIHVTNRTLRNDVLCGVVLCVESVVWAPTDSRVSFQQNLSGNSLSGAKKVCDKIWPKLQLKVLFMAKFALNKSC